MAKACHIPSIEKTSNKLRCSLSLRNWMKIENVMPRHHSSPSVVPRVAFGGTRGAPVILLPENQPVREFCDDSRNSIVTKEEKREVKGDVKVKEEIVNGNTETSSPMEPLRDNIFGLPEIEEIEDFFSSSEGPSLSHSVDISPEKSEWDDVNYFWDTV